MIGVCGILNRNKFLIGGINTKFVKLKTERIL